MIDFLNHSWLKKPYLIFQNHKTYKAKWALAPLISILSGFLSLLMTAPPHFYALLYCIFYDKIKGLFICTYIHTNSIHTKPKSFAWIASFTDSPVIQPKATHTIHPSSYHYFNFSPSPKALPTTLSRPM